ncbi:unnamed protein product [Cochlearia groenlandica]
MVNESTTTPVFSKEDLSSEEFDIDFEFDAPRFYDFSRPELYSETEHIEIWFQSSGNYPPSPFSPKFNWKLEPIKQITSTNTQSKPVEISNPVIDTCLNHKDKYNGFIYYNQTVKQVTNTKPKSRIKPINSTLTRPTASLLARQNKPSLDNYSVQLLTRCQRSLGKFGDNLSPLLVSKLQRQYTKRQKLEAKKIHVSTKPKLTVPKEPILRTAQRSEMHRSKVNSRAEQNAKSSVDSSKRHTTTNKKVNLETCSTALPKSNTARSQGLQAFRLRTSLKAKDSSSKSRIVQGNHSRKINSQVAESKTCPIISKISSKEELSEVTKIKYGTQSFCRTDMKPFLDIKWSLDLCRNFDSKEVAGSLIIA